MKVPEEKTSWFFVDESGDPAFYGKGGKIIVGQPGCSRILILGFIQTADFQSIHDRLTEIRKKIADDPYLTPIPSVKKSLVSFHAKDDCPEVRMIVFRALAELDFSAQIIVGRKIEPMFRSRYKGNQDLFYDDLISRLFENNLHKAMKNVIIFEKRGNRTRQHALRAAIQKGADRFKERWKIAATTTIEVSATFPTSEPCLQVVDYANWAVQRAYEKGDMRYFNFLRSKYELVLDVYDKDKYKGGGNFYARERNPFDIKKTSSLG